MKIPLSITNMKSTRKFHSPWPMMTLAVPDLERMMRARDVITVARLKELQGWRRNEPPLSERLPLEPVQIT